MTLVTFTDKCNLSQNFQSLLTALTSAFNLNPISLSSSGSGNTCTFTFDLVFPLVVSDPNLPDPNLPIIWQTIYKGVFLLVLFLIFHLTYKSLPGSP